MIRFHQIATIRVYYDVAFVFDGTRDLDFKMLKTIFTNVKEYYAVDLKSDLLKLTESKIKEFPTGVKVHQGIATRCKK